MSLQVPLYRFCAEYIAEDGYTYEAYIDAPDWPSAEAIAEKRGWKVNGILYLSIESEHMSEEKAQELMDAFKDGFDDGPPTADQFPPIDDNGCEARPSP